MGDGDFAAEFAVDLDGDFEHVLAGEVFVADGPGLFENRAGVAEAGPEFFGGEGGEGGEQEDEFLAAFAAGTGREAGF